MNIKDRLKKLDIGLSVTDTWPWKPYKGYSVGWVIDTAPKYVQWSLEKGIRLNNAAFEILQICLEIYDE